MTKTELDQKTSDINSAANVSAEEKTRRISQLNGFYEQNQTRIADEAKQKQQTAEGQLKSDLKAAYMQNPAASIEDFERDYPQLKSDYLRGEAMRNDAAAREAQTRMMRGSF